MRASPFAPAVLSLVVGGLMCVATPLPRPALAQGGASTASSAAASTTQAKPADWSFVEKANAAVAATPGTEDLSPVLFPAVAAMIDPPSSIGSVDAAMLLSPADKSGWAMAETWAKAEQQQAALKALATVTDPKKKFLLALPYSSGKDADATLRKAGLYVELPPSGLLQGARYRYRFALERLIELVNIEATRRAEEGKADEALNLCVQWLRLARIITEREGARERRWGITQMMLASERLRDLAFTYRENLSPEALRNTADDIDDRLVQLRRIRLPLLERLAAEQLMARVIEERGEVNKDKFAVTMARLSADDRSLNLFGQAAWYRQLASGHAGWFDTRDQINKVFGGWENRWNVENLHDPLLQIPSDYAKMDKGRFALIELTANEIEGFERLRLDVMTQLAGTRVALGVVGYERKEKKWPPNVSAVAPAYVRLLDNDPYGYDKRFKNLNAFLYRVPIRGDVKRERETPRPHEMTVGVGESPIGGAAPSASPPAAAAGLADFARARSALGPAGSALGRIRLDPANPPDAAKLKELLTLSLDQPPPVTPEGLAALTESLQRMAAAGMTPDSVGATLPDFSALPPEVKEQMGFDPSKLTDALRNLLAASAKGPKYKAMFDAAQKNALTTDIVNEANKEAAQAMKDPAVLDPLCEALAEAFKSKAGPMILSQFNAGMGALGAAGPSASSTFTATVTEKDFLLWSVGPDGVDNQAKSVGTGGSDILIWPPILSLRRENAAR